MLVLALVGLLATAAPFPVSAQSSPSSPAARAALGGDLDWADAGTCYEIFVRSFSDSDGDGVGDLRGLIRKLDYLNDGDPGTARDLGVDCLWLMPIAASPSYHGYDVTDFYTVDPRYGSNDDFLDLMRAAHARGIRVLVDLVVNHVSDQHPWFVDAARRTDSRYRDWFRWADTPGPDNEYGDNNWRPSPAGGEYYYGFFSPVMPDLNWESPALRREMENVATFWLEDMGVDGFRMDAVRHLMEDATGRSTNVARTHDMLRQYEEHIRSVAPGALTIGEVFDSTAALRAYYPDQLDGYFAFQAANAIIHAVRTGQAEGVTRAILELQADVPDHRWFPFLRNHDQRRTMTELEGDVAGAKLAATLLLTSPGLPFIYYGEEIGMAGDKPDPRIRTPMQWSTAPAAGFTTGTPWEPLSSDSLTRNVAVMDGDPGSLLNHYRKLIHARASDAALRKGDWMPLDAGRPDVSAYLRRLGDDVTLVVANLSADVATDVGVTSAAGTLPAGRYTPREVLQGLEAEPVAVGVDGRLVDYVPMAGLAPRTAYVVRMAPEPDPYQPMPYVEIQHPEWTRSATLYELNTRQFTREGTFRAAEADLPRLKELGVDILWLMPVHEIGVKNRKGTLGSPYSVKDHYSVNPEFGTLEDLKHFVDAAHGMGMHVILDWVANHTAWDNALVQEHPEWYERDARGNLRTTPWWDWDDIIELDYGRPGLRRYMIDAMKYWVSEVGVDGFRCDVAGFVPVDFWNQARRELDAIKPVFMLAEWESRDLHANAFDATYAWTWNEAVHRIAHGQAEVDRLFIYYSWNESAFPPNSIRMTFVSNHDKNAWEGTQFEQFGDALESAIVLSVVGDGIPMLYNGQEAGNPRRLAFFEKDPIAWRDHAIGDLYRKLFALKHTNTALGNGAWGATMVRVPNDHETEVLSFVRANDDDGVFAVFNFSGARHEVSFRDSLHHGRYTDYFGGGGVVVDGTTSLTLEPWSYRVYVR